MNRQIRQKKAGAVFRLNRPFSTLGSPSNVMTLVISGMLNKPVGAELGISEITVKAHRGQVMQKMKADSSAHLLNMALRLRLTS